MAELKYADIFSQHIIDMYAVELKSNGLFQSNSDIQIVNGKQLKLPKLTTAPLPVSTPAPMTTTTKSRCWITTVTLNLPLIPWTWTKPT